MKSTRDKKRRRVIRKVNNILAQEERRQVEAYLKENADATIHTQYKAIFAIQRKMMREGLLRQPAPIIYDPVKNRVYLGSR